LSCLGYGVVSGEFSGCRIKAELTGDVNRIAGLDGLRVRAESGRSIFGVNCFVCHNEYLLREKRKK
jgi:hypothetical protein